MDSSISKGCGFFDSSARFTLVPVDSYPTFMLISCYIHYIELELWLTVRNSSFVGETVRSFWYCMRLAFSVHNKPYPSPEESLKQTPIIVLCSLIFSSLHSTMYDQTFSGQIIRIGDRIQDGVENGYKKKIHF